MKLIKIFGGLVLVLLVLFFLMRNTDLVSVDLVFKEYNFMKLFLDGPRLALSQEE